MDHSEDHTDRVAFTEADLAAEIRQRRIAAGLSQAALAAQVGYSREYVSRAERPGRGLASEDLTRSLDDALHAGGELVAIRAAVHDDRLRRRGSAMTGRAPDPTLAPASVVLTAQSAVLDAPNPSGRDLEHQSDRVDPVLRRDEFLRLAATSVGAAMLSSGPAADAWPTPADREADGAAWARQTARAVRHPTDQARSWDSRGRPGHSVALRPLVDWVMLTSIGSEYTRLEECLPDLLGRAELATFTAPDDVTSHAALSDVYAVVGWLLIKADDPFGARLAADRAVRAAERIGDPLRTAAAIRCLAEVHMRGGHHEKAIRTALLAIVGLDGARPLGGNDPAHDRKMALSLRGAALLSAAAAAARYGEAGEARRMLAAAARDAEELRKDCHDLGTVFGPTNIAIHRVAVAVELGDAPAALREAAHVDVAAMPDLYAERRARYLLDLARAHVEVADVTSASAALMLAERYSTDEVHHHRITRSLVPRLLAHSRHHTALRDLARACGVAG